jgi:hypothetical protein
MRRGFDYDYLVMLLPTSGLIAVYGIMLLMGCTPGSVGSTIKTIDDIAVALCEVAAKDDPSLISPGQTLDAFCHGADVLQSFKAEASGAKQRAVMHLKTPELAPMPTN